MVLPPLLVRLIDVSICFLVYVSPLLLMNLPVTPVGRAERGASVICGKVNEVTAAGRRMAA